MAKGSPKLRHAASSSSSVASVALHSRRTVAPSVKDATLSELARHTKRRVQCNHILRGTDVSAAQWKWLENVRNFSIYTKQESSKEFSVLAIGVVKGSVPEVASLLISTSQDEYVRKMEALYEKDFKHGMYVNDVAHDAQPTATGNNDNDSIDGNAQLSVRTATFERAGGWLSSNDEWCFLESTAYNKEIQRLDKLMTTLKSQDVFGVDRNSIGGGTGGGKHFRDVISAFRIEPDQQESSEVPPGMEDGRESHSSNQKPRIATRVQFFAEHNASSSPSSSLSFRESLSTRFGRFSVPKAKNGASDRAVRQRLVHFAKSCDRLSLLVRRRRLGMQIFVDQKRFLQAKTSSCFCCDKNLGIVAKVCRVCGQGVCADCSAKYERETHLRRGPNGRVRLESVRVCDPCLARVESADYSSISDSALAGPAVLPDRAGVKPPSADLKGLLHDALLEAPSPQRKGAVMSVIRCVLDQEKESTPPTTPSPLGSISEEKRAFAPPPVLLTPVSTEKDYVDALDYLNVPSVAHTEAEIAAPTGRGYVMDSLKGGPDAPMTFPLPENEQQRLDAIHHTQALGTGTLEELNIICEIASKELNSFASLITLITADEQRVIGANMAMLADLVLKREDAFCAHTIMGDKPLVVPHPEADIRFSKIMPVTALGAKFYCGFPIVADDAHDTVIGSLCCIDKKANELTESQYAVLRRLAQTASKVVRIEGAKRRNSAGSRTHSFAGSA